MGSNKVDFLHHPVAEQDVERLLLEPLDDPSDRFKYMHDYRKNNATEQGKCNMEGTTTQHGKKAGILQVIESESTTMDLSQYNVVEEKLYSIIREQGLAPVSSPSGKNATIVVVMKEGYVISRLYPKYNYCSLDIHLWGAFQKSESLRSAIIEALGSTEDSSYRIVVGGMFGASTLSQDESEIGIQVSQTRNCEMEELPSYDDSKDDRDALNQALEQSLDLVAEPKFTAVVLCGLKDEACTSFDLLQKQDNVAKVIPIWSCPDLKETSEELDYTRMYRCEAKTLNLLHENLQGDEIDLLIMDTSASYEMAQIMNSIFNYPQNRESYIADDHVFISLLKDSSKELWRRQFLELYRRERHVYTLSRVEVELKSEKSSMSLEVLYCGDRYVFQHLLDLETELATILPSYRVQVKRITGGELFSDPEYNLKEYPEHAYDRLPAIRQALDQLALGRQSIFQFEYHSVDGDNDSGMPPLDKLVAFFEATLDKVKYSPFTMDKYTDVGDGAVIVTYFKEGTAIFLWDGRNHIDINLFSSDQEEDRANLFAERFKDLSNLSMYLRDDQPRGVGKVMQFDYEFNEEEILLERESAEDYVASPNSSRSEQPEESCVL